MPWEHDVKESSRFVTIESLLATKAHATSISRTKGGVAPIATVAKAALPVIETTGTAVVTIPHSDFLYKFDSLKVNPPPWLVVPARMSTGVAIPISICVAIDSP